MITFVKTLLTYAAERVYGVAPEITSMKKGIGNWVTTKDLIIEKFVINELKKNFPFSNILSEESMNTFDGSRSDLWIFDPLDGTTNATYGLPIYGISLAYMKNGEVILGAIYDLPNKQIYFAEKGKGTFVQGEKRVRKLHVRDSQIKNALVCTGSPYTRENFVPNYHLIDKIHKAGARLVMLGSAVIECCYVAEGKLSAYYEKGLKAWDIAAGSLLIAEAGGVVADLEGKLDILQPTTFIAGSKEIVRQIQQL